MSWVVSRNTMVLPNSASSVDDYYIGYDIEVTRLDTVTGKETVQRKTIAAYNGANKVITINGLWDSDAVPTASTGSIKWSFRIIPSYQDTRVSINPAVQALDYITSNRYGRGLHPVKDLDLPSWLESARVCDTRSDIYVKTSGSAGNVGDVYRYPAASIGPLIWQGKIAESHSNYFRFTEIIGKLTNKWNSWKNFPVNSIVYEEDRIYLVVSSGTKQNKPVHMSGTVDGLYYLPSPVAPAGFWLEKVSGTGPSRMYPVTDGNPIRFERDGRYVSGYTLYDSDGVDYWRHIGWDSHDQRNVTRHQTNITVDTSLPLFDNMNSILDHFGGILRYSGDRYVLEVEKTEDPIANSPSEPRNITTDHIIGKIRLSDEGIRSAYNSLTVSFADPANKFEPRNISFFNSDFLKTDKNVPKKGSVSIPGITNYYNARILADKYLSKSRYGLTISLTLAPQGLLLQAGKVIQLQYPRYNWVDKKFRIESLTYNEDCTVDIVAKEYDPIFYVISNVSKPPAIGLAGDARITTGAGPSGLVATSIDGNNEAISGIFLTWTNDQTANPTNVTTEIHAASTPYLYLNVISITDNVLTVSIPDHELKVGDTITDQSGLYGLEANKTYFIKSVPQPNQFTISVEKGGPTKGLTNVSNINIYMLTANIIAEVTPPESSYIDVFTGDAIDRVTKYYWIRHKIIKD